jgi:hypothetical protein
MCTAGPALDFPNYVIEIDNVTESRARRR